MIECEGRETSCLFVNVDIEIESLREGRRSSSFLRRSDMELVADNGKHNVDGKPSPGKELTKTLMYLASMVN